MTGPASTGDRKRRARTASQAGDGAWLVTGAAGFIGSHLCHRLLADGHTVVGIDNINDYYEPLLKQARLARLIDIPEFAFHKVDLRDGPALEEVFAVHGPQVVINLAAQAGVRHSLREPLAYVDNNVVGFMNVLEQCRQHAVGHLVYASSSSVYGATSKTPFSVRDPADHPVSLYAATKRANELMAHTYSHLYGLPTTGLRFFTVYGPWGRPDMAYYSFAEAITAGRPITVFGDGSALRDFTYIDDIVEGVVRVAQGPATPNPAWRAAQPDAGTSTAPWRLFNIGHGHQVTVNQLIGLLEELLGESANRLQAPEQPGDVPVTHADVTDLYDHIGFCPQTNIETGLARFVEWFREYSEGVAST